MIWSTSAFGAEANFYTLNEKWAKNNLPSKTDKGSALEEGFATAASNRSFSPALPGIPAPVAVRRSLQEIVATQGPVEIELNQTLFVEDIGGLSKFVATDDGIAVLENLNTETLQITGSAIGSTFVHIWNAGGRKTFALRVTQPKVTISTAQLRQLQDIEKNRPFRFTYDNGRSASYNGEKFRTKSRTSSDFTQNFRVEGDTPYGAASGHMQTQKAGGKTLLTDAQVTLKDGKIGPLDNFNATAGDSQVKPDLMIFPGTRVRGLDVQHWDDDKRMQWQGFYGRENSSVIGILTPGVVSERTLNSYLSGGIMDYKVNDDAKVKAGYFTGSGQSRADTLNRLGMGVQTDVNLGEHASLKNETDFDNEEYAHKHAVTAKFEKLQVRNEFRDINRKFVTMIGSPSRQGEVGNIVEISASPNERWSGSASLDIFRDRLIPNPEAPDSVNIHSDALINWFPCEEVNLTFNFQDLDDTGRLGPSRQRTSGLQYNERFDVWGHNATLFARYQHRTNHLLTNSESDYRQNQAILGFYTQIFWGINFSLQKEWNALEEMEISRYTHPAALIYSLDYTHQVGNTPFFMEARLRIRDEEETESTSSFMAGEDSTEISGGLYYREYEDLEIFLTGSFTQYVPESLNVPDQRIEAEFYTGMRYSFDTGFQWGITGSFDGYVYKDENGDGVHQPEEPGMPGMTVTSSDGKQAVTDAKGYYEIKSVSGKMVTLTLESEKIPHGYAPTSTLAQQVPIEKDKKEVSFGLTPRSEVAGIVFNDLDANGKYESGKDLGVAKVKITLEDGQSVRSNTLGAYTFSGVLAGEHTATLALSTLPEGYLPLNVPKRSFTLYEGIKYELYFPLKAKRTLTGRVFFDENKNNLLDEKETVLSDISVVFAGQSVISDREGWYLFDDVKSGSFELAVDRSKLPAGFLPPAPVKIIMPAEPLTMSDINIPVTRNPERQFQTEETV